LSRASRSKRTLATPSLPHSGHPEAIHLNAEAKEQLTTLKRRTGLKHNNVLCRWALTRSLAEPSLPNAANHPTDTALDIEWRVFAGAAGDLYWALVVQHTADLGQQCTDSILAANLRLHLHRGLGYLQGETAGRGLDTLLNLGARRWDRHMREMTAEPT
jgi:DNA sulfur modification protein DndE